MHAGGRISLLHGKPARCLGGGKFLPAQGKPGSHAQAQLRGGLRGRLIDMKTLDVGLLVDSVHADKYVEELALWGKNQPHINISHLIVHPRPAARLALLPARAIWRTLLAVERVLLRWSRSHKDHYAVRDLTKIIDQIVDIRSFGKDVEKVRALGLDLLIDCGSAVPRGDILRASR